MFVVDHWVEDDTGRVERTLWIMEMNMFSIANRARCEAPRADVPWGPPKNRVVCEWCKCVFEQEEGGDRWKKSE